jgi:DNA-binding NtrC family response regulator
MPEFTTQPVVPGAPAAKDSPIVLVVDDDADVGEATAVDLRRAGMRVRTALNVDYALDCCRTQSFDAVVLDHHPADGYSEKLLEEAPDMGLAVVVSDAKWDVLADMQKRHGAGVFGVKVKPVTAAELVHLVRGAVTASRSQPRSATR